MNRAGQTVGDRSMSDRSRDSVWVGPRGTSTRLRGTGVARSVPDSRGLPGQWVWPGAVLVWLLSAGLAVSGCGKEASEPATPATAKNAAGTPGYLPPVESQGFVVNGQVDLVALTKALRNYSQWKMRVPKDLNELVLARYITNLPVPPPGQKLAIDEEHLEVILVDK